jgi:hypothetical protein
MAVSRRRTVIGVMAPSSSIRDTGAAAGDTAAGRVTVSTARAASTTRTAE